MPDNHVQVANVRTVRAVGNPQLVGQAPVTVRARVLKAPVFIDGRPPAFQDHPVEPPHGADGFFPGPTDVPRLGQRTGNLFAGPADSNQEWYLPTFVLVDDPDPAFGFATRQTAEIDQTTGDPFNTCRLTMTLRKVVPPDAVLFAAANPGKSLREVPLENLEAAIVIQTMKEGAVKSTVCPAKIAPGGNDTFLLTADGILGVNVIALYQNLTAGASAKCVVSASYRVWRVKPMPPAPPGAHVIMRLQFEVGPERHDVSLDIKGKYATDLYRIKYTIAPTGGGRPGPRPHVIVGAEDLRGFNVRQTEFMELRTLGDVSSRYPSISKLYLGVISRTVRVIPARYVILRETAVCAATCHALVDSSPGLNAGCKFEFDFTLVPDVSSIDLLLLINEVNARSEPELHNLTFQLPTTFTTGGASELVTLFLTASRFVTGASDARSLALSAEIKEQAGGTPAVANANMFIAQLRTTHEPFLTGSVGVHLDDAFPTPIPSAVMLNFKNTQAEGPAGLTLRLDEPNGKAILENGSAFDLRVTRIALLTPNHVSVVPLDQVIPASKSLSVDLPAEHAEMSLLSDCELAITDDLSKSDLFKLLQFQTVDVQNTQYLLSINASGVNFVARAIDQIDVRISLLSAPDVAIPSLSLSKDRRFDSARILLPLQHAMVELAATLEVAVSFLDPGRAPLKFTLPNDFGQHPSFVLSDPQLPV